MLVNDLLRAKWLMLRAGTVVDATLIAAPCSTKNASVEGALPRAQEEHRAAQHAVCAVQAVDGPAKFAGRAGMSGPSAGKSGLDEADEPEFWSCRQRRLISWAANAARRPTHCQRVQIAAAGR